ncbi:unnamed protein product [Parascedosporium putredinis]|uniref:Thioredoxin domain-containing protein n=1 Tax=Parascedosporium putredinis TaxID=1442378 RepID=A0A9P1GYL4_9PEZI|nr:unnamed protein product [Parascedosporium putredinis]CAI7990238.1 unnamed protein product [Parascedosporium putredinis]
MPITTDFKLPASPQNLALSPGEGQSDALFVAFISGDDVNTKQPWCPDVRAALPHVKAAFSADGAPEAALWSVGQRDEWRQNTNPVRTKWNVHNIPTVVRYQRVDGKIQETGRLVEGEILNERKLSALIKGQ